MDKVFIPVLVMLFTAVLAFMIANTSASIMFPIFDNMSASMTFMQGSGVNYGSASAIAKNSFFIGIFIVVAIPVAYLLFRLLRKERQPQEQQGYPVYYPG